jgi:penicillin-binding protein 1A
MSTALRRGSFPFPNRSATPGEAKEQGRTHAAPRRLRRPWWIRQGLRVLLALLTAVVLVAAVITVLVLRAPSVADAPQLVADSLADHHAPSDDGVVPTKVGDALLATEDSRFYSDPALDPRGVIRAIIGVVSSNGEDGGATIEQQLAKMIYAPGTSIGAELKQVGVAFRLDQKFSKHQILAMYLDEAYFGDGAYGITEAAEHYFGRPAGQLTWGEASLLAGLVQAPSAYDPHGHLRAALARRRHVLDRLVATHQLSSAAAAAAARAPLDPVIPFTG